MVYFCVQAVQVLGMVTVTVERRRMPAFFWNICRGLAPYAGSIGAEPQFFRRRLPKTCSSPPFLLVAAAPSEENWSCRGGAGVVMVAAHWDHPYPTQARLHVLADVSAQTGLEPRTPWAAPGSESGCLEPPSTEAWHANTWLGVDNLFNQGCLSSSSG